MRHPVLPLFPEKFFADTAHVSAEAAAFYMVLIAHAWTRGGSLPNNDVALRNMTRLSRHKWVVIRHEILPFWTVGEDGRLHQKRLDAEWKRASEKHAAPQRAMQKVAEQKHKSHTRHRAQKVNEIKDPQFCSARARDPTPTPTPTEKKNSLVPSESSSSLARAPLCVRPHATPALRLVGSTEASPAPEDQSPADELSTEQRAKIAEGLARLAASISGVKNLENLDDVLGGTKAELEHRKAEEKLIAIADAEKPVLTLSPFAKASPLVADYEQTEKTA